LKLFIVFMAGFFALEAIAKQTRCDEVVDKSVQRIRENIDSKEISAENKLLLQQWKKNTATMTQRREKMDPAVRYQIKKAAELPQINKEFDETYWPAITSEIGKTSSEVKKSKMGLVKNKHEEFWGSIADGQVLKSTKYDNKRSDLGDKWCQQVNSGPLCKKLKGIIYECNEGDLKNSPREICLQKRLEPIKDEVRTYFLTTKIGKYPLTATQKNSLSKITDSQYTLEVMDDNLHFKSAVNVKDGKTQSAWSLSADQNYFFDLRQSFEPADPWEFIPETLDQYIYRTTYTNVKRGNDMNWDADIGTDWKCDTTRAMQTHADKRAKSVRSSETVQPKQ